MADEKIPDSHEPDEAFVGEDQPGENLASHLLPDDVAPYTVDDPEAEELDPITDENPTDPDGIDDEAQLEAAEEQARAARSTRDGLPTARPRKRAALGDAQPEDSSEPDVVPVASLRPAKKKASAEVAPKGHATPKQKKSADAPAKQRVGLGEFLKQIGEELRKVVWPTGSQLWQYFVVVLVYVLMMIAIVSLLDFVFGWSLLKLFG